MKTENRPSITKLQKASVSVAALLSAASLAHATIDISTVYVGDAGNANDSTGYGGVSYGYNIGTYEVTNAQYAAFLNAAAATDSRELYNTSMATDANGGITRSGASGSYSYAVRSDRGNRPVNFVSFWDAARFTNWLTSGDTETGVYVLSGVTSPTNNTITRNPTAWDNGGVAIASVNEWYKAAYYQPAAADGDSDGYWSYPTRSNSISTDDANYNDSVGNTTAVGSYNRPSYYGTFDQGGNVLEWNDTIVSASNRGLRAGSFVSNVNTLQSSRRDFGFNPTSEFDFVGFRVSSLSRANLPEPSSYAAICGLLGLGLALTRRRAIADRKAQA